MMKNMAARTRPGANFPITKHSRRVLGAIAALAALHATAVGLRGSQAEQVRQAVGDV